MKIAVIDFETTGLKAHKSFPVDLGIVVGDVKTGTAHVKMSFPISGVKPWHLLFPSFWKAKKVHKIPLRKLFFDGLDPKQVVARLEEIRRAFPDARLAAAPAQFDYHFMLRLYELAGVECKWSHHVIDLSTAVAFAGAAPEKWSVKHMARSLNLDPDAYARHTGLGDAELTFACFTKAYHLIRSLDPFVGLTGQYAEEAKP